jgi:NAD(P)-dependent dehydrogenase (short-subunit alcohol dehydrogenase family)
MCDNQTLIIPADLTTGVDEVFDRVDEAFGHADVLVANAGAAITGPVTRISDSDWQTMIDINLTAPFRCVRRALPSMIARDWGRIVVMGSVASRQAAPYIAGYAATKHGVLGLVRAAATEVAKTGVTVNAVCPGFVDSPMTEESVARIVARTGRSTEEARAALEQQNVWTAHLTG